MQPLRERLRDWKDSDATMWALGLRLGIFPEDASFGSFKYVFWSRNALGDELYDMLRRLVAMGAIKFDLEEDKYRWNPDFDPDVTPKKRLGEGR